MAADDAKVGSLLSTLLNLNASGYADDIPEKDRGFDKPNARVLIRLKDGVERVVTFGAKLGDLKPNDTKDKDSILLSVSGRSDVFKVQLYVFDTATKTSDLIKKEEAPATAPYPPRRRQRQARWSPAKDRTSDDHSASAAEDQWRHECSAVGTGAETD